MGLGIVSFGSIVVLSFFAGFACKRIEKLNNKWIPVICGAVGLVLGIVAYLIGIPDFPGGDLLNAAAIGVVSGLAATGIHQIKKQLSDDDSDNTDDLDIDLNADGPQ